MLGGVVVVVGKQKVRVEVGTGKRHALAVAGVGLDLVHKRGAEQRHVAVAGRRAAVVEHVKGVEHCAGEREVLGADHGNTVLRDALVRVVKRVGLVCLGEPEDHARPGGDGEVAVPVLEGEVAVSGRCTVLKLAPHKLGVERIDGAARRELLQLDLAAHLPGLDVALDLREARGVVDAEVAHHLQPPPLKHVAHARGRRG